MSLERARPPALAEWLLERALGASVYADDIAGDLHESYAAIANRRSLFYARWWYRAQAARLAARYVVRLRPTFRKGHAMDRFTADLRYAVRSLVKRPLMSAAVVVKIGRASCRERG